LLIQFEDKMMLNATQRNATQRNATQRNATQRNATQRNATQRNATQLLKKRVPAIVPVKFFTQKISIILTTFLILEI